MKKGKAVIGLPAGRLLCSVLVLTGFMGFGPAGGLWAQEVRGDAPRVISLYAAHTENILRLGGRDLLVGISAQETYDGPEASGWVRPAVFSAHDDVEKYLAVRPTLIMMRPQHQAASPHLWAALEKNGVKVWSKQVQKASEIYGYWRELGQLVGLSPAAARLVEDFSRAVRPFQESQTKVRPGVFLEAVHKEIKTFTPDSIPMWVVELAGGCNVAAGVSGRGGLIVVDFGPEKLLAVGRKVDIYLSQEGPMNRVSLETVKQRSIFREIPAFKNGRVYKVPETLIARPTPALLEGVKQIFDLINQP
ncbi:MAG: ABC transporter substrate-binding protein [Deltaproteobacteria bacterium]|jgi:iron complex transport system substrate-binding protein|nr:ABC transporter substrate-binding protein [Deltaproteobacteria bacterium]